MASSTHATIGKFEKDVSEMHEEMVRLDGCVKQTEAALEESEALLREARADGEHKAQQILMLEKGLYYCSNGSMTT